MRIGLTHKRLDLRGGTERDLYRTAEGLRDLGHEVHLFCAEFGVAAPSQTFAHQIPVLPLGRTARLWSSATWGTEIIRRQRCDLVVGFGRMVGQDVLRSGGGTHRGFLQRFAADGGAMRRRLWESVSIYHRSILALEKRQYAAAQCRKIIAVSNEVKLDVMKHYQVPAERIAVLYNGVDLERFHPGLRRQWRCAIRRQWSVPEQSPLLLFVGSGFRRKGLDRLLAVWNAPELRDVYLLVVGEDARMGQYRARARAAAGKRILFAGRQNAVERYYGAADAVVLPSIQEAFGNVVLEGLACGLPAIVTRGVGAAEILQGSLAQGVVENPDDRAELAQKIGAQLQRSREPACIKQARQLGEGFSWRNHFSKLESLLMEVRAAKQRESLS
jgi:UDP-glucose:(heptosyl)LPS alpha-1,3-glucosyltransferase